MPPRTVVVTDHDFESLDVEESVLNDIAEIWDLSEVTDVEFNAALAEADGVLNLRHELNADALACMNECQIVAQYGIGVDNIAVDTAAERGIYVTNVPDYCLEEVAIHALSLLLAISRGVTTYDRSVADGEWDRGVATPLHRLSTQTVGIVGFGDIGRALARRLNAFDVTVLVSDPFLEPEDVADESAELVPFEQVLSESDYVSVHSPLTLDTRGMFDAKAFDTMKDDAVLINVARGPIVDESALVDALESGSLRAAGLDVFDPEPPTDDSPLRDHPRVVSTPHVAWYSEEANNERRYAAAECVRAALTGATPENVVAGPADSE
jgi:D-3-phosphoglycerate dehydrogenase